MQCTTGALKQRTYRGDYKQVGQEAESVVISFLKQQFQGIQFEDVRQDRCFQMLDVDLIAQLPDGRKLMLEIKSDRHLGKGNFLVEVLRKYASGGAILGWLYRSRADYVLFWASEIKRIYVCDLQKLREYVAGKRGLEIRQIQTDRETETLVFLLSEEDLKKEGVVKIYGK